MSDQCTKEVRRCSCGVNTFHETLLDYLTQLLHVGFGEVPAALGLLKPFIGSCTRGQTCGSRLRDIAVSRHGVELTVAGRAVKEAGVVDTVI